MTNFQELKDGRKYEVTGDYDRSVVQSYHRKPSALEHNKTKFAADIIGLKPVDRAKAILRVQDEYASKFTIGYEIEKNSFHRGAVQEYPLLQGFERDGSCGYEAVTNILPLLPEGKWRNKVYEMFVQAEKIIDSRYSPADRRCGGHVTLTCKDMSSDELREKLRAYAGILLALFEKRISNRYCGHNLRMQGSNENWYNGPTCYEGQGTRYQFALEKTFGYRQGAVEFRIVSKFESVKQCFRRYELFYALMDTAINKPTTFAAFLKRIRPTVLSMYGNDAAACDLRLEKAKHYQHFINTGNIHESIVSALDPNGNQEWRHMPF